MDRDALRRELVAAVVGRGQPPSHTDTTWADIVMALVAPPSPARPASRKKEAIRSLLARGIRPDDRERGWERFRRAVCDECGVPQNQYGYGPRQIRRIYNDVLAGR